MRTIKFRAFDKKTNTIREVVRIDFDNDNFNYMLRTPTESAPKHWTLRKSDEVELMQHTGLKDKNGKEIYEGDILSTHRESYFHNYITGDEDAIDQDLKGLVVIIASKGACLKKPKYYCNLSGEDGTLNQYYNFSAYRSEVIGNIHENPDLI